MKRKSRKLNTSLLNKAKPIQHKDEPIKMVVYGAAGSGKTTFASSFPKPALLVDVREKGSKSVEDVEDLDYLYLDEYEQLDKLVQELANNTYYKSVLIDNMTQVQELIYDMVRQKVGHKPGVNLMPMRVHGEVATLIKNFIDGLKENCNGHICYIGMERVFKEEDDEEAEDIIKPSVGPRLMPAVKDHLNASVDYIAHSFVRVNIKLKTTRRRKKVDKERPSVRDVQYCMRLGAHTYYTTKVRKPKTKEISEDVLVDPTFGTFMSAIGEERNDKTKEDNDNGRLHRRKVGRSRTGRRLQRRSKRS